MSIHAITTGRKKRYKVRWRGGTQQRSKTFDRKEDAKLYDAEVTRKRRLGKLATLTDESPYLSEYAPQWWDEYAAPTLASGTLSSYAVQLDLRILPELGRYKLRDITPGVVQRFLAGLTKAGVGDASVIKTAAVLQSIMRKAILDEHIEYNPVAVVRKPKQQRKREPLKIPPATVELIRSKLGLRDATLVSLLAYTGVRPESEGVTLTWEKIGDRSIRIDASKTGRTRFVKLLAPLADDLAAWKAMAEPVGLVFPTAKGGAWTRDDWRNWTRRVWRPTAKAAGLEGSRPRDLRGSFASLLIWEGQNVLEVAEQLGDTKETCLGTYAGLFAEFDASNRASAEDTIWAARAKVRPQSVLTIQEPPKNPEPTRGLEPRTPSLRVKCSTS